MTTEIEEEIKKLQDEINYWQGVEQEAISEMEWARSAVIIREDEIARLIYEEK